MATVIFRKCLSAFWRAMENLDVVITAAAPDTYAPTPIRYSVAITEEYFWRAGQTLLRALGKFSFDDIYKIAPNLTVRSEVSLDGSAIGSVTTEFSKIFDRLWVEKSSDKHYASVLPVADADYIKTLQTGRDAPSVTNPYYEILEDVSVSPPVTRIYVYPVTTYAVGKIYIKGLRSCPLQSSSNNNADIFPESLSDIWIDAAIALASGETKETALEVILRQRIAQAFQIEAMPHISNQKSGETIK